MEGNKFEVTPWCHSDYIDGIIIHYNGTWFYIRCNRCKKIHKVAR